MRKLSPKRGFTILELIVVFAIIAVLISIIIDYLGQKRNKGSDAAVQSNLVNARSQAEVYYTNNNKTYEGVCAVGSLETIGRFVEAAKRSYGGNPSSPYTDAVASGYSVEACRDSVGAYAAWVPLRDSQSGVGNERGWCIDSAGVSRRVTDVLSPNTYACP